MGLITWVAVILLVLAIIGLGWQTFFAGVQKGIERVGLNPVIQNITGETKKFVADEGSKIITNATRSAITTNS